MPTDSVTLCQSRARCPLIHLSCTLRAKAPTDANILVPRRSQILETSEAAARATLVAILTFQAFEERSIVLGPIWSGAGGAGCRRKRLCDLYPNP